jgi:hypothetical protein
MVRSSYGLYVLLLTLVFDKKNIPLGIIKELLLVFYQDKRYFYGPSVDFVQNTN